MPDVYPQVPTPGTVISFPSENGPIGCVILSHYIDVTSAFKGFGVTTLAARVAFLTTVSARLAIFFSTIF